MTIETASKPAVRARTMHAAVLAGPRAVQIETRPAPEPGPGQVRVRLEGCGLCGSNLPVWQGREWFGYPLEPGAPGHEGWGAVDAVGEGVQELEVGRRVAVLSHHAFAEHDVADADAVVPLPPELDGQPFPGEALGCAMNVLRRSDIRAGQTVAVVGVGFLGAVLTALAAKAGATVYAVSRRAFALDAAARVGAAETFALNDAHEAISGVMQATRDAGCDRVIEATGCQQPLDVAGAIVRERGRLIIAGFHQDGPRQVDMQSWNWRGIDVVNAHERDPYAYIRGMRDAVEAVARGRLDPTPLYTHTFSLDELDRAFDLMDRRPDGFLKALITP